MSTEDTQGVVVRVLQQQTQAEAMVTLVVGGDGQLRGIKKTSYTCLPEEEHLQAL